MAFCECGPLSWPEEALRANIIAQVSLALNRIWTEWYPSRGYSFNITGSPGYDQAYVNGRTVFAVMERLTAELFNTYVQRTGDVEPYFTEYCDGKTVTCPGMKQWGTVDRAREGIADCIAARELIKVKVLENSEYSAREAADILCEAIGCECVQVIGRKFVLFKQKKKESAYTAVLAK